MKFFERAPRILIILLPFSLSAFATGYITATPTPPATHNTVPKFSMCDGMPRGPTTSRIQSPLLSLPISIVVFPTSWIKSVIMLLTLSVSAIVIGILSPFS